MTAPVATINDHTLNFDYWAQVKNWLSYSDADGDAATKYQFWDSGAGADSAYFYTPTDTHHAANTVLDVAASDLASVWVGGGTANGSETMWVRAYDGHEWGNWDLFTLTTHNDPPVATINDHTLNFDYWAQVKNWLSYSDANGDAATKYQFWDSGAGADSAYFYTPSDTHHAANTVLDVAASDLASVWVGGGTANGSETMWVRAYDGHAWGNWDLFTLTTHNDPPVATINDQILSPGYWGQVSDWLSYSDANGDAATKYQFWDSGTAASSAHFYTPSDPDHPANATLDVAASDLGSVWVGGGSAGSSDTMWVRAYDGHEWGNWDLFTVNTNFLILI